ncbi:MAG: hypothetical protein RBS49_07750 [Sphaerochaeta sp.]|nr:hypothetical protein [Sphaerochaeta sp.]MDX9915773.1 hypothetical protein [Sphaerochaeta sp.]
MRKKGVLVLLILGLLLLVGCDSEAGRAITPLEACDIATEWGEGTSTEPWISFLLDPETGLGTMDINQLVGMGISKIYYVVVSSTTGNTISGTYHIDDDENPVYDITITLFHKEPKLTVRITGQGPLAGRTYVVKPTPD